MTPLINPFILPEDWKPWFQEDPGYLAAKKTAFQIYLQQRDKQPLALPSFLSMTLYTFSKHTVLSLILLFVLMSFVTTVAAQALAPEEFKPLTNLQKLFGANKQPEQDPYTALKPDDKNDVALLASCDLAIKYPKMIGSQPLVLESFTSNQHGNFTLYQGTPSTASIAQRMSIRCEQDNGNFQQRVATATSTTGFSSVQAITKEDLRVQTGWFVTEAALGTVLTQKTEALSTFEFAFNNLHYSIEVPLASDLTAQSVQFQFNSLVKNEFSAQVGQSSSSASQAPVDSQTIQKNGVKVTTLKSCPQIQISYRQDLQADLSTVDQTSSVELLNYVQEYGIYREPQPTDLSVRFVCRPDTYITSWTGESYIQPTTPEKLPFLNEVFRKQIDRGKILDQDQGKKYGSYAPDLADSHIYNFGDKYGFYYEISTTNQGRALKEFDLKIDWLESATSAQSSSTTVKNASLTLEGKCVNQGGMPSCNIVDNNGKTLATYQGHYRPFYIVEFGKKEGSIQYIIEHSQDGQSQAFWVGAFDTQTETLQYIQSFFYLDPSISFNGPIWTAKDDSCTILPGETEEKEKTYTPECYQEFDTMTDSQKQEIRDRKTTNYAFKEAVKKYVNTK